MRPALSILFFTTLSGAGYGLWFLLGLAVATGAPMAQQNDAIRAGMLAGLVLSTAGLLFSVAHLGRPERAWRAFSQWRSSWLSREGVAALGCALVAFALAASFSSELSAGVQRVLAIALLATSVLVVFCTARIYSSLPTIAAWHNRYVLPVFLSFAFYTGSLFWWLLAITFGADDSVLGIPAALTIAFGAIIACACKVAYWRHIDRNPSAASTGSAIGLERLGTVRSVEQPHTEANYLTREMAFVVARKHAGRLRLVALLFGFAAPLMLLAMSIGIPSVNMIAACLALLSAMLGAFVERWLFFAEAKH
ncbi:MAG: DmsC/YnfH family molybdoenzyme membrane anchor subunit, partial [Dokdonella sp.]